MDKFFSTKNVLALKRAYLTEQIEPMLPRLESRQKRIVNYRVGGAVVRICFFGEEVYRSLAPAIAHLVVAEPTRQVDYKITAWDSVGSGLPMSAPWRDERYIYQPDNNAQRTMEVDFRGAYLQGEQTIRLYDSKHKQAYLWMHDASVLPQWVKGAPFRALFHWFLVERGVQLVHGAVVGSGGVGVLLTARGGSGKSTTALSALRAGMEYVGDDYVGVDVTGNAVYAHSLYQSLKIICGAAYTDEFVIPGIEVSQSNEEKALVMVDRIAPSQIRQVLRLSAVCIPRITSGPTRMVPARASEAFLALAPTTLFQLPLASAQSWGLLRQITERLPCYILELGPQLSDAPAVIKSYLDEYLRQS